jgi:hypothetical protein
MIDRIQKAVEQTAGGKVSHVESTLVVEAFRSQAVWEGLVEVFKVETPSRDHAEGCVRRRRASASKSRPAIIRVSSDGQEG